MKILCYFGFHKWVLTDNNFETEGVLVDRTYEKCLRCDKWGALVLLTKRNAKTGKLIERFAP